LHLAFDEIRHFGVGSLQIPRRLRAALLDLETVAPPDRKAVLDRQLQAIDEAVDRAYDLGGDRAMAQTPDPQGLR
jgi:hypothetical protein